MALDRRRFLQLSALGVVATIADSACARDDPSVEADAARSQLVSMLGPERVRQLGAQYRASTPAENSKEALRAALARGHSPGIPLFRSGSFEKQIHDDFAEGRTVVVDGWVLAVTEARQAALYSLSPTLSPS